MYMEFGLVASGGQPMVPAIANLTVCAVAAAALYYFPGSKMYRHHLEKCTAEEKKEQSARQQVKELGLDKEGSSLPEYKAFWSF